jgi:tRNA U34 5-methylaminomethyl-2-thiouridine-forming methyltransferase MnmC
MMPHQTYQLWQIERLKTTADQRATDAQLGTFAAAASRSTWQAARTTVRAVSRLRPAWAVRRGGAQIPARVAG